MVLDYEVRALRHSVNVSLINLSAVLVTVTREVVLKVVSLK